MQLRLRLRANGGVRRRCRVETTRALVELQIATIMQQSNLLHSLITTGDLSYLSHSSALERYDKSPIVM